MWKCIFVDVRIYFANIAQGNVHTTGTVYLALIGARRVVDGECSGSGHKFREVCPDSDSYCRLPSYTGRSLSKLRGCSVEFGCLPGRHSL